MSDFEAPEADVLEQAQPVAAPPEGEPAEDVALEAPEADAAEQRRPVREAAPGSAGRPVEADEADVGEQMAVVEFDEEEYR